MQIYELFDPNAQAVDNESFVSDGCTIGLSGYNYESESDDSVANDYYS